MSKKMLKRSLALGALMAFVITGSAMAAGQDLTPEEVPDKGSVFTKTDGAVTNTLTGTGTETVTLKPKYNGTSYSYPLRSYGTGNTATVSNLYEILISGDYCSNESDSQAALRGPFHAMDGGVLTLGTADAKIGSIKTEEDAKVGIVFNVTAGTLNINADIINVKGSTEALLINQYSSGEANVTINAKDITLASDSIAIYNYGRSDSDSTINIIASNELNIIGDGGVLAYLGNVEISGKDIYIEGGEYGAITGYSEGNIDVSATSGGKAEILGDIYSAAEVSVGLGAGGSLTGAITTDSGAITTLDLGTNSTWTATGDSNVTTVAGDGNIRVDMTIVEGVEKIAEVAIDDAEDATIEVSGTGAVSDYLAANGKTAEEALAKSVTAGSDNTPVDTEITTEEGMTGGAYTLKVNDDGSVVATQAVNTKSDAVSDAGMTLKGHWRAHMNDMNKRMGELRMANGEHGVWTRMVRGESEYQGAKMQYNQYQLGYDEKLSVDKRWTVGAAVTFSEGDSSYGSGSTDDKSTTFAIYGSKLNNDGTFVDLIARYAHLESDLDDRNYGTGDYSTNGMSVSAEFGKRIQQGNGLWIEPQVELTYGSVDSADVAFDGGAYKAHYDSMDSFIARAGFALGKDIKQGNVYARASYLYDFDGETETQFEGGKAISEDFGGGWWEVGVGANINLSKATYIYADIEKTFGGEVDTNWQWNLGVRYSF